MHTYPPYTTPISSRKRNNRSSAIGIPPDTHIHCVHKHDNSVGVDAEPSILTGLVALLDGFRLEELLEVGLAVERRLVALVAVDVQLLAALHAPEAVLVPD